MNVALGAEQIAKAEGVVIRETLTTVYDGYTTGEIIVPPLTWVSDIAAVLQNGFFPVFADVNPKTLSLDTDKILEKIVKLTKAVFIIHV